MTVFFEKSLICYVLLTLVVNVSLHAVPPDPHIYRAEAFCAPKASDIAAGKVNAIESYADASSGTIDNQKVAVILIDFRDVKHDSAHDREYFENLIFSASNPFSLYSYYMQASCGQMQISGEVIGWVTSSHRMSYYGEDKGIDNLNCYIYELAHEAFSLVDNTEFGFSEYDKDGDGFLDHLIIIHAGHGQEDKNSKYGKEAIWSHHWNIELQQKTDKIRAYNYCMVSEYSPVGVLAHEFGHDLGLPDLYDCSFKTNGVGVWDIMGYGAWLMEGKTPSLPSAWSRMSLGWTKIKVVSDNQIEAELKCLINNENIDEVIKIPISSSEYFLIENRQRMGFDRYLPGDGVLIWHIDDSAGKIVLEEADARDDLGKKANYGDASDTFSAGKNFTPYTKPNSLSYSGSNAGISIDKISESSISMNMDISIGLYFTGDKTSNAESITSGQKDLNVQISPDSEYYKPSFLLGQNYPNPFNPETWIPYQLNEDSEVTIIIYSSNGQIVRTLSLGYKQSGCYTDCGKSAYWDGRNMSGELVSSGVYFYQLRAGKKTMTNKMVIAE